MKPTLDQMCKFMARQLAYSIDPEEARMLEAIFERLNKEQTRRRVWNRKRQDTKAQ